MNALLIFIGLMCSGAPLISGLVLDVKVRPGDDIVIHCDCAITSGVLVRWYRNCSHTDQPMLVLKLRTKYLEHLRNDPLSWMTPLPRFRFVKNDSSNSYDMLITNITQSDEGLYFCGTETHTIEDNGSKIYSYVYGNTSTLVTLITALDCHDSHHLNVSWVALVPAAVVLFSNVCLILLYHCCQKQDAKRHRTAHWDQDCFSTTVVFATKERKIQ